MSTETNGTGALDHTRLVERLGELSETLETLEDARAKDTAQELIAAIMGLHAEGLARMLGIVDEAVEATLTAADIRQRLIDDGIVASLFLIHDLYPVDLETRVREALATVRPYMESHGGDVELLGIEEGVARLRLAGHCKGCPASAATLELAIKQALDEAAPDLEGLEVEGVTAPSTAGPTLPLVEGGASSPDTGFTLPIVNGGAPPTPTWMPLDSVGDVDPGTLRTVPVRGVELVVANVEGTLLAYRSACAACGEGLAQATLSGPVLTCPGCGRGFDLPHAGRAADGDELQLDPVPLLRRAGAKVEVAVA